MFINLTPHTINLPTGPIEPSGQVARCAEISTDAKTHDGVPLVTREYGPVTGLPKSEPNVLYIVSAMVRMASPDRIDLASPGDLERDVDGKISGAKNLVVNL